MCLCHLYSSFQLPITAVDMSKWEELGAPAPVVMALRDLKFSEPTAIQSSSIPPALVEGKDIIGAAETVCVCSGLLTQEPGVSWGLLDVLSPTQCGDAGYPCDTISVSDTHCLEI